MEADASPMLVSGGRVIRLPMGWVFVAVALMVGLCWLAYEGGFRRGRTVERNERLQSQGPIEGPERDPLLNVGGTDGARPAAPTPNRPAPIVAGTTQAKPSAPAASQGKPSTKEPVAGGPGASPAPSPQPVQIGGDPRTPGLNYFVVARLPQEDAEKAAAFLSARGVGTAVIPDNNPKFMRVIASRGFAKADLNGPEASKLKADIRKAGRAYKSEAKGPTDFADLYAERRTP